MIRFQTFRTMQFPGLSRKRRTPVPARPSRWLWPDRPGLVCCGRGARSTSGRAGTNEPNVNLWRSTPLRMVATARRRTRWTPYRPTTRTTTLQANWVRLVSCHPSMHTLTGLTDVACSSDCAAPGGRIRRRRFALAYPSTSPSPLEALGLSDGSDGALARLLAMTALPIHTQGPPPADPRALETLVRVEACSVDVPCAICLEDINESASCGHVAQMPRCSHIFHESCVLPWLRDCNGTCPVCRTPLAEPPLPLPVAAAAAGEGGEGQAAPSSTFSGGTDDEAGARQTAEAAAPECL